MDSLPNPPTPMDVSCLEAPSPLAPMEIAQSPQPCSSAAAAGNSPEATSDEKALGSPPIDERSLHETLAKNREKLQLKLLTRRPIHQLVQQGIIPPLKASPQFLEQKQRLERARMGDFLKNKMQQRPDRDTLIRAHILEDTSSKLDPSLQEKQRRLKRARLKDDLNDRLAHRPGPLELIRGNILQADESFAQALKEGTIPFKRTCEGDLVIKSEPISDSSDDSQPGAESVESSVQLRPAMSSSSTSPELLAPFQNRKRIESPTAGVTNAVPGKLKPPEPTATATPPPTTLLLTAADPVILCAPESVVDTSIPVPPPLPPTPVIFTLASQPPAVKTRAPQQAAVTQSSSSKKKSAGSAAKSSACAPQQPTNKNRIIKFHEYKGPPSAVRDKDLKDPKKESPYELLLQQQKVFLQWQTENGQLSGSKQKIILPAPTNPQQTSAISSDSYKLKCSKLEDMKVPDLKVELKKRNLPVSGSKPQLIERLKPFSEEIAASGLMLELTPVDITQISNNNNPISLAPDAVLMDEVNAGDADSVLAKMDILHKELLEKQRIQSLFQHKVQHTPPTNLITITDASNDQAIQVNRVLCQPGVQIIHAKPQLVTLQMTKSEPSVVSVTGLASQNIAIVSPVPPTVGSQAAIVEQNVPPPQVVGRQPSGQIIGQLQPVQLANNSLPIKQVTPLQLPETSVTEKPLLQQHLQHQIFIQRQQPTGGDLDPVRVAPSGPDSPSVETNAAAAAAAATPTTAGMPRKKSLVEVLEEVPSLSRPSSLPTDIDKFMKKPPEYTEATKQLRKETEYNLNDILEIISKQDSPAKFEVSRNPETGLVTLKEATRDTPKTSQIVTSDIKTPVIINNLSSSLFEKENQQAPSGMTKLIGQNGHFEMKPLDSNDKDGVSFKGPSDVTSNNNDLPVSQNSTSLDERHLRPVDEKPLDFAVNLDDLETMDLSFDDHIMHQPASHSKQPFQAISLEGDQMSTDFQDLDWWSNDLLQLKTEPVAQPANIPLPQQTGPLQTPEVPCIDPMLSFSTTSANACGLRDFKGNNNSTPISLYSDMQGFLCDDIMGIGDWTNAAHGLDLHMQM